MNRQTKSIKEELVELATAIERLPTKADLDSQLATHLTAVLILTAMMLGIMALLSHQ